MADVGANEAERELNIFRCALTGAAVMGVIFSVFWLGAALNLPRGPHMFLAIFSPDAGSTTAALGLGLCRSILFGALAGALSAHFYNVFAPRG